jgi:hypothetical protein
MPKNNQTETTDGILFPPEEIREAIARITTDDRNWFAEHPDAEFRERPPAAGEFWPVFDSACVQFVIVTQVRPGWRLRFPVIRMSPGSTLVQ